MVWGADFFHGITKKFCLLRRDLAKLQLATAVINKVKADLGLLDWARRQPDVVINQWAQNSHYTMPHMIQLVSMLREADREITPQIDRFGRGKSCRLAGSQPLEDGFNSQKASARVVATKRLVDDAAYHSLIKAEVMEGKHSFTPPRADSYNMPRGLSLDPSCYRAKHSDDLWKDLRQIMGTNPSPKWYSPGANSVNEAIGHHFTLQKSRVAGYAAGNEITKMRQHAEVCSGLLSGQRMMVKEFADSPWVFVAGMLSSTCFVRWPATMGHYRHGKPFFDVGDHPFSDITSLMVLNEDCL